MKKIIKLIHFYFVFCLKLRVAWLFFTLLAVIPIVTIFFFDYTIVNNEYILSVGSSGNVDKMIISLASDAFVPLVGIVYLALIFRIFEFSFDPTNVGTVLAAGYSRSQQVISIFAVFFILAICAGLLISSIYLEKYSINVLYLPYCLTIVIVFLLVFCQMGIMLFSGLNNNYSLLLYFLLFILFPLFFMSFGAVAVEYTNQQWLVSVYDSVSHLLNLHLLALDEIRNLFRNQAYRKAILAEGLFYTVGVLFCSIWIFRRKDIK